MSESEDTESVATRHKYTNDLLAGLALLSNVVLLAGAPALGIDVPTLLWQTFGLAVALAATWAFGRGALKELLGWLPGNGGGGGQS